MDTICGTSYLSVFQENGTVRRYKAFPLRCKSWDCEYCRRVKAKEYKKRIAALFDGRKLFFYTLTYFHNCSEESAWMTYNAAWNRLRTNLRKQYGRFSYVRVLESHSKSNYPHLHIIADKHFPAWKFGQSVIAAGFGYQIAAKEITGAGAATYITKYLTKEWTNEDSWNLRKKAHARIISFSSDLCGDRGRKGVWSILGRQLCLEQCVEHIRTDFIWRSGYDATVTFEAINRDNAEITVIFTECPCTDIAQQFRKGCETRCGSDQTNKIRLSDFESEQLKFSI